MLRCAFTALPGAGAVSCERHWTHKQTCLPSGLSTGSVHGPGLLFRFEREEVRRGDGAHEVLARLSGAAQSDRRASAGRKLQDPEGRRLRRGAAEPRRAGRPRPYHLGPASGRAFCVDALGPQGLRREDTVASGGPRKERVRGSLAASGGTGGSLTFLILTAGVLRAS